MTRGVARAAGYASTKEPVKNLVKLKESGEHRCGRVRKDETPGDEVVFEMGADGKAVRFRMHSNYYPHVTTTPTPTNAARK